MAIRSRQSSPGRGSSPTEEYQRSFENQATTYSSQLSESARIFTQQNETNYLIHESISEVPSDPISPVTQESGFSLFFSKLYHQVIPRTKYQVRISDGMQTEIVQQRPKLLKIILATMLWFFFSALISVYNKHTLGNKYYNFKFSYFITSLHSLIHFAIAYLAVFEFRTTPVKVQKINWKHYFKSVFPCGIASGLDIGLSSLSLRTVTLSFYTMIKSGSPVFILICAFALGLEKVSAKLIAIIGFISFGVFLTAFGETEFEIGGCVLVISASIMSALRWSLTQLLMDHQKLKIDHPLLLMLYISPVIFVILFILCLILDGLPQIWASVFFANTRNAITTIGMISVGGLISFSLILSEFYLINLTSAVTLSVTGVLKEILVILISLVVFKDTFTLLKGVGFSISLTGIIAYHYLKHTKARETRSHRVPQFDLTGAANYSFVELEDLQSLPQPGKTRENENKEED